MISDLDILKQIMVKEFDNFADHSVRPQFSLLPAMFHTLALQNNNSMWGGLGKVVRVGWHE